MHFLPQTNIRSVQLRCGQFAICQNERLLESAEKSKCWILQNILKYQMWGEKKWRGFGPSVHDVCTRAYKCNWLHVLHKWKSEAWRVTAPELSNQYPGCQWGCVGTISTSEPSKLTDVKWQAFTEAVLPSFLSLLFSLAHRHAGRPHTATTLHPLSSCCFVVAGGVVSKWVFATVCNTLKLCAKSPAGSLLPMEVTDYIVHSLIKLKTFGRHSWHH